MYRLFIFFLFRLVRKFSVYHFGDNLYINYCKSNPGSVLTILFFLLKSDKEIGVIGNSSHCASIRQSLYKHQIVQNIFFSETYLLSGENPIWFFGIPWINKHIIFTVRQIIFLEYNDFSLAIDIMTTPYCALGLLTNLEGF